MSVFASISELWTKIRQKSRPFSTAMRAHLAVETLESRVVPYALTGNAWPHAELVTLSFQPDGTNLGGVYSNLLSKFNARWSQSAWQNQILKAAQTWAQQTNLNFAVVADSGAASGSGNYQQGDPSVGDIRIGGFGFGSSSTLALTYLPPPVNNYSIGGDIGFNTNQPYNIGYTYDLFTVALHEVGHALGLGHSSLSSAVQYSTYNGTDFALNSDDIAGIRAIYGARAADQYDAAAPNGSFVAATDLTPLIEPATQTALVTGLDITSTGDVDYYTVTAPSETSTLKLNVQSKGLSLLAPVVRVYDASQTQVAYVSGLSKYGTTLSLSVNVAPGERYSVMVDGADNTAFGTGAYAMALNFGSGASPAAAPPNTQSANGNPLNGGGGMADRRDANGNVVAGLLNLIGGVVNLLGGLLGKSTKTGCVESEYFHSLQTTDAGAHHHHGAHLESRADPSHGTGCGCPDCTVVTALVAWEEPNQPAAEDAARPAAESPRSSPQHSRLPAPKQAQSNHTVRSASKASAARDNLFAGLGDVFARV